MNLFWAAFCSGALAFCVAIDCGLPLWRNAPAGDATDFALLTGCLVWHAISALRVKVIVNNNHASEKR